MTPKARPTRVLDAHLHLWDPARLDYDWLTGRLRHRFGPDELRAAVELTAPTERAFVFIQAECRPHQSLDEVDWVSSFSATLGIRAIVARVALEQGRRHVERTLDAIEQRPLVAGVRRLLQDEPAGFATSAPFIGGARALAARGYTFDACVRAAQIPEVTALADAVPSLAIVLDHLGNPPHDPASEPAEWARWEAAIRALAARPNVVCKASGIPEFRVADTSRRHGIDDILLEAFGPSRLMIGSDWPVSVPYGAAETFARTISGSLSEDDADSIRWRTAARIYDPIRPRNEAD